MMRSAAASAAKKEICSQDALELTAGSGHEVKVSPVQVPLERLVGSTTRRERLIQRRMVLVPREPVFPIERRGVRSKLGIAAKEAATKKRTHVRWVCAWASGDCGARKRSMADK